MALSHHQVWMRLVLYHLIALPVSFQQCLLALVFKVVHGGLVEGGDQLAEQWPPPRPTDGVAAGQWTSEARCPQARVGLPPGRHVGSTRLRLQTCPLCLTQGVWWREIGPSEGQATLLVLLGPVTTANGLEALS